MQQQQERENWVGWAAVACGVHCLVSPLLVLVLPVVAHGEAIESVVLLGVAGGAIWLLAKGMRRHGRWLPVVPAALGMCVWLAALLGAAHGTLEAVLMAGGGLLTFASLRWSRRLGRACDCVACEAGAGVDDAGAVRVA